MVDTSLGVYALLRYGDNVLSRYYGECTVVKHCADTHNQVILHDKKENITGILDPDNKNITQIHIQIPTTYYGDIGDCLDVLSTRGLFMSDNLNEFRIVDWGSGLISSYQTKHHGANSFRPLAKFNTDNTNIFSTIQLTGKKRTKTACVVLFDTRQTTNHIVAKFTNLVATQNNNLSFVSCSNDNIVIHDGEHFVFIDTRNGDIMQKVQIPHGFDPLFYNNNKLYIYSSAKTTPEPNVLMWNGSNFS